MLRRVAGIWCNNLQRVNKICDWQLIRRRESSEGLWERSTSSRDVRREQHLGNYPGRCEQLLSVRVQCQSWLQQNCQLGETEP